MSGEVARPDVNVWPVVVAVLLAVVWAVGVFAVTQSALYGAVGYLVVAIGGYAVLAVVTGDVE